MIYCAPWFWPTVPPKLMSLFQLPKWKWLRFRSDFEIRPWYFACDHNCYRFQINFWDGLLIMDIVMESDYGMFLSFCSKWWKMKTLNHHFNSTLWLKQGFFQTIGPLLGNLIIPLTNLRIATATNIVKFVMPIPRYSRSTFYSVSMKIM